MYSAKTLDIQCKNTVHAFALLYIRKKSTNRWLKKKSTYWINQKYYNFYTFTEQVLQHFHRTFIFSCGWSQFDILLFYFDL